MICIAPTERATDGPCETCGWDQGGYRHQATVRGMEFSGCTWLGLPKGLCLHGLGDHETPDKGGNCVPCYIDSKAGSGLEASLIVFHHTYLEGEWCPMCRDGKLVWPQVSDDGTEVFCPTCQGFRAVASVEVGA